jgi:hypothetical protein
MTIENASSGTGTLSIHKPISVRTLLTILGTPILYSTEDHSLCPVVSRQPDPRSISDGLRPQGCAAYENRPRQRPIDCIGGISLDGGQVDDTGNSVTKGQNSPALRLQNTKIGGDCNGGYGGCDSSLAATIIQVLRLAGIPWKMRLIDSVDPSAHVCRFAPPVYPRHLEMALKQNQANAFCKEVRVLNRCLGLLSCS